MQLKLLCSIFISSMYCGCFSGPYNKIVTYPDRLGKGISYVLTQEFKPSENDLHGHFRLEWSIARNKLLAQSNDRWHFSITRRSSSYEMGDLFFFEFPDTSILLKVKKSEIFPHSIRKEETNTTMDSTGIHTEVRGTTLTEYVIEKGELMPSSLLLHLLNMDYSKPIVAGWGAGPHQVCFNLKTHHLKKIKEVIEH